MQCNTAIFSNLLKIRKGNKAMYISQIALDMFRSWHHIIFDCKPGINIIYGNNGLGKTNIIEALEVASTGFSHRTSSTVPLIARGHEKAVIRIKICNNCNNKVHIQADTNESHNSLSTNDDTQQTIYEIILSIKSANRARINAGKSLYMRDIIGSLPVVSFTPRDQSLIIGDPSIRRTFIDQAGSLLIPNYAQFLQEFKHVAQQRAALLRNLRDSSYNNQSISLSGLEIWTGKFIETGIKLTKVRQKTVQILNQYFKNFVTHITSNKAVAELQYFPSFEEILLVKSTENNGIINLLNEHFQRIYEGELARGCNLIGPHRDDIGFMLDNMPAKDFASNGESWTLAIAAKMALCEALKNENNRENPIIILDDVFAQLDEQRRKQILNFSLQQNQVFITTSSLNDIPHEVTINNNNVINIEDILIQQKNTNSIDQTHQNMLGEVLEHRHYQQENKS